MKRLILIGATVLLIVAGVIAYFITSRSVPAEPGGSIEFPSADDSGAIGTTEPLTIADQRGNQLVVRNFIENGTTAADPANDDRYIIAGETGYCDPSGECVHGVPSDEFNIIYEESNDSFIIALKAEPLSSTRFAAENLLKETLGLSEEAMCSLNYAVLVDAYVNETYAGENLGFSFCSGATRLP